MPFGEVSIEFTDNANLMEQLEKIDFEALAKTISDKLPTLTAEKRSVREDLKDLVDTDGKFIIFKKVPRAKIDMVILAIHAYGTSATIEEIRRTTGIQDPSGDVINSGTTRKYFMTISKQSQTYGLSPDGIQRLASETIPKLRQTSQDDTDKGNV